MKSKRFLGALLTLMLVLILLPTAASAASTATFDLSTGKYDDDSSPATGTSQPTTGSYDTNGLYLEKDTYLWVGNGANVTITGTSAIGTGDGPRRIVIASGATATITLDGVSITAGGADRSPILLNSGANLTLTLLNTNTLVAGLNRAGIGTTGATLTIDGTGTLNVTGGSSAAGIGGGNTGAGGTITISGGNVTATGGNYGAGIGGGNYGAGGTISISGTADVTATGGIRGAGIGGGNSGAGGTISISGTADVTATGGYGGAGIGGGNYGAGGIITIKDSAKVTAVGGNGSIVVSIATGGGAGIGSGGGYGNSNSASSGNITISGDAVVTATGGDGGNDSSAGAGIGTGGGGYNGSDYGNSGSLGTITITTSVPVTATGGAGGSNSNSNAGAGIGTGGDVNGAGLEYYDIEVSNAAELTDALSRVLDGGTIRLLASFTYNSQITLSGDKMVELDLNGFTLTVNRAGDTAISMTNAMLVATTSPGSGGKLIVNGNITADGAYTAANAVSGIAATRGGVVEVHGDITVTGGGAAFGVNTADGATVTVNGDITVTGDGAAVGVFADNDTGTLTVEVGNIYIVGGNSCGVHAEEDGTSIVVNGDISVTEAIGGETNDILGVNVINGASIEVFGNILVSGEITEEDGAATGVDASGDGTFVFHGNVTVNITGDEEDAVVCGVHADGAAVGIGGDVAVNAVLTGTGGKAIGVYADEVGGSGAEVTVDGEITVLGTDTMYITFDGMNKTAKDPETPSTDLSKLEYYEYTNSTSYVWVRDPSTWEPPCFIYDGDDTATSASATRSVGYTAFDVEVASQGIPRPVVNKVSGNPSISYNNARGGLVIAVGLPAGTYPVVLEASNVADSVEFIFTFTVTGGGGDSGGGGGGGTSYTVKFEPNGGSEVASQSVASGGKATKPTDPIKSGYTFAGWYSDEELTTVYDFNSSVTKNITLYAKWTWNNPFTDVKESDWFYKDVEFTYMRDLMLGTGGNLFSPNMPITRGMIVTILYRVEGSPDVNGLTNPFDDVEAGKWYYDAVLWAAANDIVEGYGNGKFGPDDSITRQDLVTILWRYAKYAGIDVSVGEDTNILSYNDAFDVAEYAIPAMQWACGEGIITGKPGGLLDPKGTATRAEVAAMLHRFLSTALSE